MMHGHTPVGVILAGGKSSRMGGGDKCLLQLGAGTILDEVVSRLAPQATALCLNANGDSARFDTYGLDVIADTIPDRGPLGGVLAGMTWAAQHAPHVSHILTAAADTPFLPKNLVSKLGMQLDKNPDAVIIAASGGRLHPTFALWPIAMQTALAETLDQDGALSVRRFAETHGVIITVDFPFSNDHDPFFNINDARELTEANRIYAERHP